MERRSTWPCLHIWRSVIALLCLTFLHWALCCISLYVNVSNLFTWSSLYSWTIASSLLLLPKTSAWSSTPEMQRSLLPVPSGTSLGVDTLKPLTGKTSDCRTVTAGSCNIQYFWKSNFFLIHYSNRVTGIYELGLCKMSDSGSPGEQR